MMGNEPTSPSQNPNYNGSLADYGQNQDYLKKVDHDVDMQGIRTRLDALEAHNKNRAAQTAIIKDVLENDRNIDPVMTRYIGEHIDLQPKVEAAVKKLDREWWKSARGNAFKIAGAVILALISGLAGYFIRGN